MMNSKSTQELIYLHHALENGAELDAVNEELVSRAAESNVEWYEIADATSLDLDFRD